MIRDIRRRNVAIGASLIHPLRRGGLMDRLLPREHPVRLIDETGRLTADDEFATPPTERLLDAYRALVRGRRINEQANALVRQGRLAVYPSSHGQEACQVAAALVLREGDWLFPTYRDSVAVITRGVDPEEALVLLRGDWHGGYDPHRYHTAPRRRRSRPSCFTRQASPTRRSCAARTPSWSRCVATVPRARATSTRR
jgi:hypothetical protein